MVGVVEPSYSLQLAALQPTRTPTFGIAPLRIAEVLSTLMEIEQFSLKIAILKNANKPMMEQQELIIVEMEQHLPIAIGSNANQHNISIHSDSGICALSSHSQIVWERMESIPIHMVHSLFGIIQEIGISPSNIAILRTISQPLEQKMFISSLPLAPE
jgi:hypothetical protein